MVCWSSFVVCWLLSWEIIARIPEMLDDQVVKVHTKSEFAVEFCNLAILFSMWTICLYVCVRAWGVNRKRSLLCYQEMPFPEMDCHRIQVLELTKDKMCKKNAQMMKYVSDRPLQLYCPLVWRPHLLAVTQSRKPPIMSCVFCFYLNFAGVVFLAG